VFDLSDEQGEIGFGEAQPRRRDAMALDAGGNVLVMGKGSSFSNSLWKDTGRSVYWSRTDQAGFGATPLEFIAKPPLGFAVNSH